MPNPITANHSNDLVVVAGGKLVSCQAQILERTPYIVFYFGAGWCPDCRKFSPLLAEVYNRQPAGAKRFEVLLVSHDKSADEMLNFMTTEKMKWPALAFDKIASADDINLFFSDRGIPCLTVTDQTGRILLQSKNDQDGAETLRQLEAVVRSDPKK